MARVLFINAGSEGHINPTIGVVQELISRGEEVVYFTIEAFRERMEETGAIVRTLDAQQFIKAFISGGRDYLLERVNGLYLRRISLYQAFLNRLRGSISITSSMIRCLVVDVYWLKFLIFLQSTLVLLLHRQRNHLIKSWNDSTQKPLKK